MVGRLEDSRVGREVGRSKWTEKRLEGPKGKEGWMDLGKEGEGRKTGMSNSQIYLTLVLFFIQILLYLPVK